MYYLSHIAKAMAAIPEVEEYKVTNQHPRFAELCEIYGAPVITRTSPSFIDPKSIEARLINFTFHFRTPASGNDPNCSSTRTKKIPRTFDIYRLKGIVGRLFGQKPMSLKLVWESGELDPVAEYEEEWDSSDEEEEHVVAANGNWSDDGNGSGMANVNADELVKSGKWVRREVELPDSTREVGFWIEEREAKVRVEWRRL